MRQRPSRLLLALDVGGTKTSIAAYRDNPDETPRPLGAMARFATPRRPEVFLDDLTVAARQVVPDRSRVDAIGIGVPGPLDAGRGIVVYSPNVGWSDVPIAALVSERFGGVPVLIDDDSNAGALGEAIAGAGRGANPFAYLPLGTGLGSGIVIDGQVATSAHGAGGEIGHMAVGIREGPRCGCGRRNCVEAWCAGNGLARRARETWPARRLGDGSPAPRDAAAVFRLARRGDADAAALVARAEHALATALASILAVVDPAVVCVGGSIGEAEPAFVRVAFHEARRRVIATTARGVRLRAPRLGQASVLAGAAVLGARAAGAA